MPSDLLAIAKAEPDDAPAGGLAIAKAEPDAPRPQSFAVGGVTDPTSVHVTDATRPHELPAGPASTVPLKWGATGPQTEPNVDTTPPGKHWWEPVLGAQQFLQGAKAYVGQIPEHIKQSLAATEDLRKSVAPTDADMNAVSDMIEGGFETVGKPLLAVGAAAAPVGTAIGLGLSAGAAKAAHATVKASGGSDAQARLTGNVAGALAAGVSANEIIDAAKSGGRTLTLAAKLSGSGYGTGDVPGFRGTPTTDQVFARQAEVVDTRGAEDHGFTEGVNRNTPKAEVAPPVAAPETPITVPVEQPDQTAPGGAPGEAARAATTPATAAAQPQLDVDAEEVRRAIARGASPAELKQIVLDMSGRASANNATPVGGGQTPAAAAQLAIAKAEPEAPQPAAVGTSAVGVVPAVPEQLGTTVPTAPNLASGAVVPPVPEQLGTGGNSSPAEPPLAIAQAEPEAANTAPGGTSVAALLPQSTAPANNQATDLGPSERFLRTYGETLAQAVAKTPEKYGYGADQVGAVALKMASALAGGTANLNSPALKAAAKKLGVPNTNAGWKSYFTTPAPNQVEKQEVAPATTTTRGVTTTPPNSAATGLKGALDIVAVRRAWSNIERPPQTETGLASAVPDGQPEASYRTLAKHYEQLAKRAEKKSDQQAATPDKIRWMRLSVEWQKAASAAKLHFENATSETPLQKEGEPDETIGESRAEEGTASARPESAAPKNPEAVAVRAYDVLLNAVRANGTAPFPKNAAEFRKWLANEMGVMPATLAADVDQINDAVEAALAETMATFAAAHLGAWDAQFAEAERLEQLLPKAHRTLEKTKLQQFSTPLTISVRAGQAADVQPSDRVLEPTAGTGNLLVSVSQDVPVTAVELSARRADLLRAEHYNVQQGDYLGAKVSKASVIISNPPWGKYSTGKYGKAVGLGFTPVDVAERFVGKMYRDLQDGGRLVAVMPTTMLHSPSFKNWLKANGTVRAIIQSPPGAYDTRATGVDSLLLVYDKKTPAGVFSTDLPAVVVAKDWAAYAQAVQEVAPRESIPERPAESSATRRTGEAARPAPGRGSERVPEGGSGTAERGRHADVPAGRDTGVVADERGPQAARGTGALGPGIVEQPDRATADALRTAEGEFAEVIDHSGRDAHAARGSREFAPYVRRTQLRGVGHPKLVVEARQLAGVQYPPLTLPAGVAIHTALREKRVSVEQAEQALAAVQANVVGHHGYLAADNVGVGKSREIALVILDLMERAKAEGRDLRLVVTTKSKTNIRDLVDNELYYVATGRTRDGLDLLNVDAPKVAPPALPFEIVETDAWPDAKRTGTDYKPMPTHRYAIYVTDFANLAPFRQGLVDIQPHGVVGDEAHSFKNVEGSSVGGAWQNLHAEIIRGVPREQQVFAYFTATPAQNVNDYQYLYGLRLWPLDGFAQWANLATGGGDEKDAAALEQAVAKGAFNMDRIVGNKEGDVVGGDAEDVGGKSPSKFAATSYSDIFTSKLTPAEAEQIPREWKMLGRFSSRDLWREGQEFRIHEAKLPAKHAATYDKFVDMAQAIAKASYSFGLLDKSGKRSRFGVTGQLQFAAKRIQMQPALEEALKVARTYVDEGYQVVLSVINVEEMDPQKGNIAAAIAKINDHVVEKDPNDPDGGFVDGGEIPEAMVAKAELLERAAELGTFDDPVRMVEDAFGRDQVSFITGQDTTNARRASMKAFQEGKRPVAFLSGAGATGINLDHRVLTEKGPGHGRRVFIDVQFEWSATQAIQRYGRVGRAASVTQPVLMPLTFGNASEKKFLATIANRMASLGALSKGGAETTGASGLEEFEITGPVAAEAARQAYNSLGDDARRYFAVVKSVFRSPGRTKEDPFEPISRAPADATMKDFQLALLFTPMEVSNNFWSSFVRFREELNEKTGITSSRTEASTGEILRQTDLGTPDKPLTLTEVKNAKGERFGVVSGLITPRMPILRQFLYNEDSEGHRTFARKYITFTGAGEQVVSGLRIPWGKVHALAETFEIELSRDKLETPAQVMAALKAGENIALAQVADNGQHWTIGLRRDGKIAIGHAKMADRTLLLNNGGGYSPVGSFWFTTEEKLAQFLERFPVAQGTSPKSSAKQGTPEAFVDALAAAPDITAQRKIWDAVDKAGLRTEVIALQNKRTRSHAGGGTTLQATIVPGGAEFVEQDVIPALKSAADTFTAAAQQLQQAVAPATRGAGVHTAGALRTMMATESMENAQMERTAHAFQQQFDRLLKTPGGRDQAIDWWDAVQTGQPSKILPELAAAAAYMRKALDDERTELQKVGKLDEFNENYFPQIWQFPREEMAWVRRKLAGLMGRRPFEGSKSFLKQRKYPTFREGLTALQPKGIEPISYNPVDHFLIKMREMRRYRVARQSIKDFEAMGIWKAFTGKTPEGWTRIEGPLGTIYGPPQVAMKEAFDPDLFTGLESFARSLGVRLARKVNIGGKRWGYAQGDQFIMTKAGGPEGVLMHEIGHILDEKYGLRGMVRDKKFKLELRNLADLRREGLNVRPGFAKYIRKGEEKVANLVHAFLYAPERAKKIAPNSYWALYNLAKKNKELKPLLTLQKTRSLKLGTRTHAIDIGGFPEIGHYAMPDDAARIFNNHLSRGLAGQSAIFDAYRWLNNSMVTGQLAFSGLRHLTFTGLNAAFSEGALVLQELARAAQTGDWALAGTAAKRGAVLAATGAAGAAAGYAIGGPLGILWATGYPLAALKFIKGWRGQRAWLTEDPGGRFFSDHVRQMVEGGFRPTWDDVHKTGSMHTMLRALRQGNYPGALLRTIPAVVDGVMLPIMSWAVPSIKTAAYLDGAAFELDRLKTEVGAVEDAERALAQLPKGNARKALEPDQKAVIKALESQRVDNLAVIREALNTVQTSIDNRFGEVVYDNWFWERWRKDLLHVIFRAPGWQAGTYKEAGGAVVDLAGVVGRARSGGGGSGGRNGGPGGEKGEFSSPEGGKSGSTREDVLSGRMAYVLAMVGLTMLMNGMAHYLSTGQRPEGKDWLYPKGPDGKRRTPVTYLATILSALRDPKAAVAGITAPINSALYRLFVSNETWNGEVIREPGDPFLKQAWDALRLTVGEAYAPFSVTNAMRSGTKAESVMGVGNAPAAVTRSDAENYLHDVNPSFMRTHEEQQHLEARRQLRDDLKAHKGAEIAKDIVAGSFTRAGVKAAAKANSTDSLVKSFTAATLPQALHAYELATPDERREIRPLLYQKYGRLIRSIPADTRPDVIHQFIAARALPVAAARTK